MTPPSIKKSANPFATTPAPFSRMLQQPAISPEAQAALKGPLTRSNGDIGGIGGLTLSSSPSIPKEGKGIPLGNIGGSLDRHLAGGPGHRMATGRKPYVARLHAYVPHAPSMSYAANTTKHQGIPHQAISGRPTATGGHTVRREVARPGLSMSIEANRRVLVHEFATRDAFRAAFRRGDIPHGSVVAFNNANGQREKARVLINNQTRTVDLIPVR